MSTYTLRDPKKGIIHTREVPLIDLPHKINVVLPNVIRPYSTELNILQSSPDSTLELASKGDKRFIVLLHVDWVALNVGDLTTVVFKYMGRRRSKFKAKNLPKHQKAKNISS